MSTDAKKKAEQQTSKLKTKDGRARIWRGVVYPESAPQDWKKMLDEEGLVWVAVLHDKDVNPDGIAKKAHYHVMFFFDGKKSFTQAKEIMDMLNAPIPQAVRNPRGMVRYLIHMDNPEKYQYRREDIECHGGADIEQYFALSMSTRTESLRELMEFISDSQIDNYDDLIMYCIRHKEYDWFDLAVNHNTLAINKQLDAIYQKNNPKNETKSVSLDAKVSQAKEMAKQGVKKAVIADTLGISRATLYRYLDK